MSMTFTTAVETARTSRTARSSEERSLPIAGHGCRDRAPLLERASGLALDADLTRKPQRPEQTWFFVVLVSTEIETLELGPTARFTPASEAARRCDEHRAATTTQKEQ